MLFRFVVGVVSVLMCCVIRHWIAVALCIYVAFVALHLASFRLHLVVLSCVELRCVALCCVVLCCVVLLCRVVSSCVALSCVELC